MKKIYYLILGLLIFIPIIKVNGLSCYGSVIDVEKISNFPCSDVKGEKLTFKNEKTKEDMSKYFQYDSSNSNISIIDKSIKFDSSIEIGKVIVSDGSTETTVHIKNYAYVKPTTTSTTTTTKDANTKTVNVTLDPNDGNEIIIKKCDITSNNTTCSISLPKLEAENFNGWGTAKTCKEGNTGIIKVNEDITYYACYKNNENEQKTKELYLKSLTLKDKKTEENINFGTFSIKNKEYTLSVLNSVESILVTAEAEDGISLDISGNENLSVGENRIVIKLTDAENNESKYTINITRLNEGETINNVNFLKSLVVGGYNINFNKETFIYNLTIPSDMNKLLITAIPEDEDDETVVKNSENLTDGSQILIDVVDQSGKTTTYTINIAKENSVNYILLGAIALIGMLIIILIILIIIKSKKKKQTIDKNINKNDNIEVLNI